MATAPKIHRPLNRGTPRQEHDKWRGSAAERGYDNDWHKCRDSYVLSHPLCEDCTDKGLTAEVDEVDHIIPFKGDGDDLRLDEDNLRSRCKACHTKKGRLDEWLRETYESLRRNGIGYQQARDTIIAAAMRELAYREFNDRNHS